VSSAESCVFLLDVSDIQHETQNSILRDSGAGGAGGRGGKSRKGEGMGSGILEGEGMGRGLLVPLHTSPLHNSGRVLEVCWC
jgi:hypothetical protein